MRRGAAAGLVVCLVGLAVALWLGDRATSNDGRPRGVPAAAMVTTSTATDEPHAGSSGALTVPADLATESPEALPEFERQRLQGVARLEERVLGDVLQCAALGAPTGREPPILSLRMRHETRLSTEWLQRFVVEDTVAPTQLVPPGCQQRLRGLMLEIAVDTTALPAGTDVLFHNIHLPVAGPRADGQVLNRPSSQGAP